MPDARRDATLKALVAAGFGAAGQKCAVLSAVIFVGNFTQWYSILSLLYWNIISSPFESFELVVLINVEVYPDTLYLLWVVYALHLFFFFFFQKHILELES